MGNILYGDLNSEHMIYTVDNSIESTVQSLYMSCNNLMAGYYYGQNTGIWSYVYKYNARNAGYLSGYCSSDISVPIKSFDSITFSDINQFEQEDYKGSIVLCAKDDFKISKVTAVNIINQIFKSWSESKPVFLTLSNYEKSTMDYLIDGLSILKTILKAFPDELQKYISFLINTIPLKNSGLKIHFMFLTKDYNEIYIKEWQRKFPYSVIDCSSDMPMPKIIPPYIDYLASIISGESEKNPVAENFFKCINYFTMERNGINMDIFSNVYSLYYFSEENFKERTIKTTYKKLYNNKKLCNLNKIFEFLNDKAVEIINQVNSKLTAPTVESSTPINEIPAENEQAVNSITESATSTVEEAETPVPKSSEPVNEVTAENEQTVNSITESETPVVESTETSVDELFDIINQQSNHKSVKSAVEVNKQSVSKNEDNKSKIHNTTEQQNNLEVKSVQPDLNSKVSEKKLNISDIITSDAKKKSKSLLKVSYNIMTSDDWINLLCIFSETLRNHGNFNVTEETIETFKSKYKTQYTRKENDFGDAVLYLCMTKSNLFSKIYLDSEKEWVKYTPHYRDSEYIGTALFMNFVHGSWIKTQKYSKIKLYDKRDRYSIDVDVSEANYLFFIVLYIYYQTRVENGKDSDYYPNLIDNLKEQLKSKNRTNLFEDEYINKFLQENYKTRQHFLLFLSLLFCDIILQMNFCDSERKFFKKRSNDERKIIAKECNLEAFIKKVKSYVDEESSMAAFVNLYMEHKYNDKNIKEYIDKFNWEKL